MITLIDSDRRWQAAATGMAPGQGPRDSSICAHVMARMDDDKATRNRRPA